MAFLTDYGVVDRIINHLRLTFVAEERPPPPRIAHQELFMAAKKRGEWENVYLVAGCSALSAVLFFFLVLELSILCVMSSFVEKRLKSDAGCC